MLRNSSIAIQRSTIHVLCTYRYSEEKVTILIVGPLWLGHPECVLKDNYFNQDSPSGVLIVTCFLWKMFHRNQWCNLSHTDRRGRMREGQGEGEAVRAERERGRESQTLCKMSSSDIICLCSSCVASNVITFTAMITLEGWWKVLDHRIPH